MGNVSGRIEDTPSMYLRDQYRLSIASLQVTNSQNRIVLKVTPNSFPATRITPRRDLGDDGLIEYVQDPDPTSQTPLLLKITGDSELTFHFTLQLRRKEEPGVTPVPDTLVNGLTFIAASNSGDVDNLVTREFHADPNLHKNPNVHLVGDFNTEGSPTVQFQYNWRWRPPQGVEEKFGGWRNTCSFVEYDRGAHKLSMLAQFSFWVQNASTNGPSTPTSSPKYMLHPPPAKLRTGDQANSPRRGGRESDVEPPSPLDEKDNFDGSTLAGSTTQLPTVKVDNCPRPNDSIMGDDGPLFRATMKSLEQRTGSLRQKMKKMLKRAEATKLAMGANNEAQRLFMESIRDASSAGNAPGLQPALDHYFERTFREILLYEQQIEINIQRLVIDPLNKLYQTDIKQAEAKKRDFEEESRDYYSYVGRYLGIRNNSNKEKKQMDSETKYQTKRKNFELKRFDYSTFMQDLHGGRKEQEVLSQLTKFADAQARGFLATAKKVQEQMPELDALNYEVKETAKEFQMQRTEREERRRLLETNAQAYIEPEGVPAFVAPPTPNPVNSQPSSSDILGFNTGFERLGPGTSSVRAVSSGSEGGPDNYQLPAGLGLLSGSTSGSQKQRAYSEQQNTNAEKGSDRRKEGLLWALSRPGSHVDPKGLNKQAWHKYWVVLAGGQLCEYSNWKQKLDLHNDPINLRMASVREARNSDRRFCFEIVTPQYKRVYQATSEDDMQTWISSINNAVRSTIEGGSVRNFDAGSFDSSESSQLKNIQSALTGKSPHYHNSVHGSNPHSYQNNSAANNIHRRITVGARPGTIRRNSSNFNDDPEKLLQMIRDTDPSNMSCADCGSLQQTQWVSINLGIILCIECSGLHRSLGTHISKVRSLTLDTTSFTPDLVDLLCQIGNRKSNFIWSAKAAPTDAPTPASSRETRLKYINTKYVQRAFVAPISPTLSPFSSADELLLDSCRRNDILGALYALALNANPNTLDPVTGKHTILLALGAADASSPASPVSPTTPTAPAPPEKTFPLAELLIQNSAEIPYPVSTEGLSVGAKSYVATKTAKRLNQGVPQTTQQREATPQKALTLRERQQREKERLQKRVSSGARLHRAAELKER